MKGALCRAAVRRPTLDRADPERTRDRADPEQTWDRADPEQTRDRADPEQTRDRADPEQTREQPAPEQTRARAASGRMRDQGAPGRSRERAAPGRTRDQGARQQFALSETSVAMGWYRNDAPKPDNGSRRERAARRAASMANASSARPMRRSARMAPSRSAWTAAGARSSFARTPARTPPALPRAPRVSISATATVSCSSVSTANTWMTPNATFCAASTTVLANVCRTPGAAIPTPTTSHRAATRKGFGMKVRLVRMGPSAWQATASPVVRARRVAPTLAPSCAATRANGSTRVPAPAPVPRVSKASAFPVHPVRSAATKTPSSSACRTAVPGRSSKPVAETLRLAWRARTPAASVSRAKPSATTTGFKPATMPAPGRPPRRVRIRHHGAWATRVPSATQPPTSAVVGMRAARRHATRMETGARLALAAAIRRSAATI
jgi:hypothetical protein